MFYSVVAIATATDYEVQTHFDGTLSPKSRTVPALIAPCPRQSERREHDRAGQHPGEVFLRRSRRFLLELNAVGQRRLDTGEAGAVAVECASARVDETSC